MSGVAVGSETVSPSGDALYSHFGFGDDLADGRGVGSPAASGHNDLAPSASAGAEGSSSGTAAKLSSPPTWQLETLRSRKGGECLNRLSERIYPLPGAAAALFRGPALDLCVWRSKARACAHVPCSCRVLSLLDGGRPATPRRAPTITFAHRDDRLGPKRSNGACASRAAQRPRPGIPYSSRFGT